MLKRINYRIQFVSPFIIATAVSRAGRFDQVSILSENLPYIPASSIRGRIKQAIRDHCQENNDWDWYRLCNGQLYGEEGAYCIPDYNKEDCKICPLCRIFGIPGGEVKKGFDFSGAYFPEATVDLLKRLYEKAPEEAPYIRRSRNMRDYRLRRAREDALFSLGLADPVDDMEGYITKTPDHLQYGSKTQEFDYALLLLGLRLVTEIGGGRNRGYGRCRFYPADAPNAWDDLIEGHIKEWEKAKTQGGNTL